MARRKSFEPPGAERQRQEETGMRIAGFYGVDPSTVRYATYLEFRNGFWSESQRWERLIDGAWTPEPVSPGWVERQGMPPGLKGK